ncbi:integrase [Rhizobium sp. Root274]|uniref:tyrosine-type recombinase/integrase n=1 Tax=unclassified Rhizobium TaxID=2613769 RepID=UPI000714D87E|nr:MULTISPECIES: site-specific integrase [unclassified Rhizobium]KQW31072.1 integrase [Rhizobium sp. Root1240]KRD32617.1 integrase [Rhizobium sp. Root274]
MPVEMPVGVDFDAFSEVPNYSVHYQYSQGNILHEVRETTLRELFSKYGDLLWMNGSHKYNVTNFIGELHDLLDIASFSTFSDEMLDQLIGKLRKRGNSNATINRKMAALSKLLRKAFKMGDVYSLPEFKRQKEKAGRIRFLDREEEDLLFSEIRAHSDLYYRFCLFLVDTGARLSEGLNLRWGDMHKDRVTFWVTKSGRSRSVPLTQRAAAAIAASDRRQAGPFAEIDQQRFRIAWHIAKDAVGFADDKDVVPHVLRHTCASRLVQGGIDIRRVQMWLGHQTLTMTMRYAHLASHDLDMCIPVLERAAS